MYIFDWGAKRVDYMLPRLFVFFFPRVLLSYSAVSYHDMSKKATAFLFKGNCRPGNALQTAILWWALRCVLFDKRNAFPYNLLMGDDWHTVHAVYTGFMSVKPFLSASKQTTYRLQCLCAASGPIFSLVKGASSFE